jgi:hypothetical protein
MNPNRPLTPTASLAKLRRGATPRHEANKENLGQEAVRPAPS